ncbi:CCAAT/enhancer-binding protein zeta-like isoform X1 [Chenopodium quinoa]|uniref:CCAAT/enhancer-binding protein zeta-like isoform X1 n=1 Tax=Chenopodium quinoa TaxID=63459 RepID=UPI000B784829|nr:CCAAT/enhancer-binding protein zeta-like isoform X1 [Chenopodium quinoa]
MGNPKTKMNSQGKPEDVGSIQSDVASFASSLGLASSLPSSGFNDSDFRPKKKKPEEPKSSSKTKSHMSQKPPNKNPSTQKPQNQKHQNKNLNAQKPKFNNDPKSGKFNKNDNVSAANNNISNNYQKSFDKFRNLPKLLLVKASALETWHVDQGELEEKVMAGAEKKRVEMGNAEEWKSLVANKKELGERLLAQYTLDYEASRGQNGDIKMLIATQRSGTATDKVSAYSVLIGDNPIANMRALDALLAMVTSKVGKRHALSGFEALKELFIQSLLPDRKLKTLIQRPLSHIPETKDGYSLLLFWYWEECLKSRYERFVVALEEASKDMLRVLKDKALKIMYALLRSKSEQERRLLTALVNKLGDPDSKAASNADYYLTNLLSDHPNMKAVVIDEVDSFLFRPHLGLRTKYRAVTFLSKTRLSHKGDGPKVAKRLVDVYFALFKILISGAANGQKNDESKEKKKSTNEDNDSHVELDSRLLSVLLTGVNRAFPFVSGDEVDEIVDVQTPMLFRLVHSENFNVSIQALMLLDKLSSKNQVVSDRFYRALYAKLLLPAALNTSKAEMFIGLLLRAMKSDVNLKRVAAFSKRLLQVSLQQPPQYACGCLFLLSEVLKSRPPLWNMAIQNEAVDEDLEHFEDAPDDTENIPGTEANLPSSNGGDEQGKSAENDIEMDSDNDSSEDEEVSLAYSSEDVSDEDLLMKKNVGRPQESSSSKLSENNGNQLESLTKQLLPGGYDPRRREPSFCNAGHTSWWELTVLSSHTHPSVSTMARTLLSGATIVYNGNPLNDLSLTAFLDKFMEKKPKQSTWHGGSQIEPAKKLDMNKHVIGPEILALAEADVPPEDVVFHKFYANKMTASTKPKKKKQKKGAEEEQAADLYGGDDSDNDEIDNLLDSNDPPLEEDGDYDYDDLDRIADEEDDDLLGDVSENEMDMDDGEADAHSFDSGDSDGVNEISDLDDLSDDDIKIGDMDDVSDDEVGHDAPLSKKGRKKSSASPFASLEEYEHMLDDDDDGSGEEKSDEEGKVEKSPKKRKHTRSDNNKKGRKTENRKHKKKKSKTHN